MAEKTETRPVRMRRERDGDTGHVITGIGFSWRCTCDEIGPVFKTWREAYDDGRAHAAMHRDDAA